MNERIYEILKYLLDNSNKDITINSLSNVFHVSARSIRNYITDIDNLLIERNLEGKLKKQRGIISINVNEEQKKLILENSTTLDYYNYKLSTKEREFVISLILFTNNSFITLDTFSDLLCVSKTTVYKDIKEVIKQLNREGISICEQKIKGYALDIDERSRRDHLLEIIRKQRIYDLDIFDDNNRGLILNLLMHYLKIDIYYRAVEAAIYVVERHYNISFSESSFKELIYIICIVLARTDEKSSLPIINDSEIIDHYSIEKAMKIIELSYSKKLGENEINYIAEKILNANKSNRNNTKDNKNINYYFVVKSFLFRLSVDFKVNLSKDFKLQEFLTSHIYEIHNRIANNENLTNPYKNKLIEDYNDKYLILKKNIHIVENILNNKLSDDEISFILMHIVAALERLKQENYRINVLLVCDSGLGTSSFLEERLKEHFNFNIIGLSSSHNYKASFFDRKTLKFDNVDLTISTVDLSGVPATWVKVTPMVNNEDITKINGVVAIVNQKKEVSIEEGIAATIQNDFTYDNSIHFKDLRKYLVKSNVILDKESMNWKSALKLASKPLIEKNIITDEYVDSIINNVIVNGPYFVLTPGVAVAHSGSEKGVNTFGISLLRLKNGVDFGNSENDPVRVIVIIAIISSEQIKDLLFNLMNVICKKENYSKFIDAKDYDEILAIFRV